jgi:sterol desaturase/sphingolipid hydroxylase (fatty acid hydroxylase superfamily)
MLPGLGKKYNLQKVACGVLLMDFTIYTQHVLHHAIPALWRLPWSIAQTWISI